MRIKPVSADAQAFYRRISGIVTSTDNCRLLLAWALLRDTNHDVLELYGLDCTLGRMMADHVPQMTNLLAAQLALPEKSVTIGGAFSTSVCRKFLLVHESGGVEWFNKERFEEISVWLSILGFLMPEKLSLSASTLLSKASQAEKELNRSFALADHVGYRTEMFLHFSSIPEKSVLVKKMSLKGIKKPKRKMDAKSPARTLKAKTSDDKISG
jgi:hypothetical protein